MKFLGYGTALELWLTNFVQSKSMNIYSNQSCFCLQSVNRKSNLGFPSIFKGKFEDILGVNL